MAEFDHLNTIYKQRSIPYEQYFSVMDLTKEQKEERVDLAKRLEQALLFLFSLILMMNESNMADIEIIVLNFKYRYRMELAQFDGMEEWIDEYTTLFASEIVATTIRNRDDEYYLSNDRAVFIAENEANSVLNNADYERALKQGKTKKKWIDIRDRRERKTHLAVGGTIIPIRQYFKVGNCEMLYPHDYINGTTEELANCRCSVRYF
jgi:hypothetical protein